MLTAVFGWLKGILDLFDPILGPDGMLRKTIPFGKAIVGRDISIVELLRFLCQLLDDDCVFQGVTETLELFMKFYDYYTKLVRLASLDNDCLSQSQIQDIVVDWTQPTFPQAVPTTPLPNLANVFMSTPQLQAEQANVQAIYDDMRTTSDWGFNAPVLDTKNVPKMLISLIMNQVFTLFELKFPTFIIQVQ